MRASTYFLTATILSLCGTLFAAYMSGYKLFTSACAFNEPCPYVLGLPACWYGLALFATMLGISLVGLRTRSDSRSLVRANEGVALVGVLFSGFLAWGELSPWIAGQGVSYALVLPTCAYGLLVYSALFVVSTAALARSRRSIARRPRYG